MREDAYARAAGADAFVVGGAVRDELLGRPVVDVDIACPEPERAARSYRDDVGGAVFPLSERHGAWRVAFRDGRTVDFTPLRAGIDADLRTRDFTVNAIARPLGSDAHVDPLGGLADLENRRLRVVADDVFQDDPLRLLRAVRLEDELGFGLDAPSEELVRRDAALVGRPAGERILAELQRLSEDGFLRLEELGLLAPLGGSVTHAAGAEPADHPDYLLVRYLGEALLALPVSNETRRFAARLLAARPPADDSPREIHRFRRRTEPWALEALAYLGAGRYADAVREARGRDPAEPLLRGDELPVPGGPEVGRLLELVEEERAVGAISTREEALELVERELRRPT
jgi:tRNA nucleotidyltransferase/poly(A) polymerase